MTKEEMLQDRLTAVVMERDRLYHENVQLKGKIMKLERHIETLEGEYGM